MDSIVSTFYLF